jgi:2-oxo-hept-3-ene-1,7-dioate hydratase
MLDEATTRRLAADLDRAEKTRTQLRQFSRAHPGMTIEDGYAIQREWVRLKLAEGCVIKGRKIGLTSRAMQISSQVDEPDYAPLLDSFFIEPGCEVPLRRCINPLVEVQLAFILAEDLKGPGITLFDVLDATAYVTPALEIIDARIEQFDRDTQAPRKVFDTISDFAACAGVVRGGLPVRPLDVDLRRVGALLYQNGVIERSGLAAAVLDHPATGVAWLANKIAPYGEALHAKDFILSGSFTSPVNVAAGDVLHADYGALGGIPLHFV